MRLSFASLQLTREAYRFIIVGVINTLIHTATALYCSYILSFSIIGANLSGFFIATTFSFFVNTTWSFSKKLSKRFFTRFFLVSSLLFSFNVVVSILADEHKTMPAIAIIIASTMSPVISFLLHKYWTYRTLTA